MQLPTKKHKPRGKTLFPDLKGAAEIGGVSVTNARRYLAGEASSRPFVERLANRAHPLAPVAIAAYNNRNT